MLDQSEREMIRKEISILSCLNHKGIVKIKEVFDSHKYILIVMEYVEGGDLFRKIKSQQANEVYVKRIIRKVLKALKYMHKLGIMHRDLKPENILLVEKEDTVCVKLIDFGLSTYMMPNQLKDFCCGTIGYSAPEIFGGKYSIKADL